MHPKYGFGIVAVGIYALIIVLVFYYFGYHPTEKSTQYTVKKGDAITVDLRSSLSPKHSRKPNAKAKSKAPSKNRHRNRPKPIASPKPSKAKPTRPVRKTPVKKPVRPKSLFAHVQPSKPTKKPKNHPPKSAPERSKAHQRTPGAASHSVKQPTVRQQGVENRYLAGVQERLYGWPTQPGFVGAKITIGLTILPNGRFTYEVLTPSSNPEFNRTITRYLDRLRRSGFDPTPGGRSYAFKVDIVAK